MDDAKHRSYLEEYQVGEKKRLQIEVEVHTHAAKNPNCTITAMGELFNFIN